MRGDSLRDFYAKALALLGLGALASVGALVDYWPGKLEVPRVAAALAAPAQPVRRLAADLAPVLPPIHRSFPRLATESRPTKVAAQVVAVANPASPSNPVSNEQAVGENESSLNSAALPESSVPVAMLPAGAWIMPATPLELSAPTPTWIVAADVNDDSEQSVFAAAPITPGVTAPSYDGISGVLRKTGSSIATIGVKTGSTIFGAFRAVGSAFRKIL